MSEAPLVKCPNCREDTLKRLIGAGSGVIFKGSGFYGTDYKKAEGKSKKAEEGKKKAEVKTQKTEAKKDISKTDDKEKK